MPDDSSQPMPADTPGGAAPGVGPGTGPGGPGDGVGDEIPWNTRGLSPAAGVAALALPGLGHVLLGLPRRGMLVAFGVFGLFLMGLLIGGLDAVDSRDDRWWFMAQAITGPVAFGVDWLHQWLRAEGSVVPGLGRMNEIGMLSCALAGLMNLIAVLDALFPPLRRRREGARL